MTPGADRGPARSGADRHQIRAGSFGRKRSDITARRRLRQLQVDRFAIGSDRGAAQIEKIREARFLVQGRDGDVYRAIAGFGKHA